MGFFERLNDALKNAALRWLFSSSDGADVWCKVNRDFYHERQELHELDRVMRFCHAHDVHDAVERDQALEDAINRSSIPHNPVTQKAFTPAEIIARLERLRPEDHARILRHYTKEDIDQHRRRKKRENEYQELMDRWGRMDQACGGDMFTNPDKLAAMRRVDRATDEMPSDPDAAVRYWNNFHSAVVKEVQRVMALAPHERFSIYLQEKAQRMEVYSEQFDHFVEAGVMTESRRSSFMADMARSYDEFMKRVPSEDFAMIAQEPTS